MNETIPFLPGLSPVAGKELCARFDGGRLSSDGGVLLFPGIERRLGIADLLASCVTDERTPASTTHTYAAVQEFAGFQPPRWHDRAIRQAAS